MPGGIKNEKNEIDLIVERIFLKLKNIKKTGV